MWLLSISVRLIPSVLLGSAWIPLGHAAPVAPVGLAPDSFYPDESGPPVSLAALEREGLVTGRTGRILVRAEDAHAIAAHPQVASVVALSGGVLRVTPRAGVDDLALSRALHARPDVRWAHPDLLLALHPAAPPEEPTPESLALPDDPFLVDEWYLDNTGQGGRTPGVDINAGPAWVHATGAGVTIAVIDSGVQVDHPDLSVIPGHDYVDRDEDPSPDSSAEGPHGTCVAGVAAGMGDNGYGVAGVAWNADVYAIRLIGGATSMEDLYDAFVEAVDAGASVLSNSWGFGDDCSQSVAFAAFTDMFRYAEDVGRGGLGSVVTFAAGNGGCDIAANGMLAHRSLIVVAALESNDVRAWYSAYGDAVDIAAPTSLLTTDMVAGGYGSYGGDDGFVDGFSGTSAATPVVSGVVALMMEANPRLTAEQVRDVLCLTAVRNDIANAGYDAEGWSPYYGCGRIDAGAAVAAVVNTPPEAPVPTLSDGDAWEGRAVLAWLDAADVDDDVLGYDVSWWREGEDSAVAPILTVEGTFVDIGDAVAVGDLVHWIVRARDPWGTGPWSEEVIFAVDALPTEEEDPPEEPRGGCQHGPRSGGLAVGLIAGLAVVRRRRGGSLVG